MPPQIEHEELYKLSHLVDDRPIEEHGKCAVCRWWMKLDPSAIPAGDIPRVCPRQNEAVGECRCSEPRLVGCHRNGHEEYEGLWPITYERDWCGKYQPLKGKGGLAAGIRKI
jgi:hypothetical protein